MKILYLAVVIKYYTIVTLNYCFFMFNILYIFIQYKLYYIILYLIYIIYNIL